MRVGTVLYGTPFGMALDNCFPVSIVVHTASSIEPNLALHLITALGKRREVTGEETYFLHVSTFSITSPAVHYEIDLGIERLLRKNRLASREDQRYRPNL